MKKTIVLLTIFILYSQWIIAHATPLVFYKSKPIHYKMIGEKEVSPVVQTALKLFEEDVHTVLNAKLKKGSPLSSQLIISILSPYSKDSLASMPQSFRIEEKEGKLYVIGADAQGAAYGIMELSRMLGVSPWIWWADNVPSPLEQWRIPHGFRTEQSPAIPYRGIFINDEDNGLCPWSWRTFDPSITKGRIGPKTHEKIFELMLRLRANVFWPAMHACSVPFYLVPGNQEMADKFGIIIGTSHCEPMLRNTNGEWEKAGIGEYNYVTNRKNVYHFWEERVKETAQSNGFYTLGMRGIHDTGMEGVKSMEQQRNTLQQVINDQRKLIDIYVKKEAPQVFIPYKEVLPVYHAGLEIPDDVTLMWCDDNYGYIRHLPDETERARQGGNGVYYHFSYWGRPQTHVWLPSTCPALTQTELERAYLHGIQKLWVFNVGDIKPNEFLTEYGLTMAWDKKVLMNRNSNDFISQWLKREFGNELGERLVPIWNEYYDLSYQRRAEFLGNTRVEEKDPKYKKVSDLPWSDEEVQTWLNRCLKMEEEILGLRSEIADIRQAHWFELVEYPCRSLTAMARKMLGAQLARHGKIGWKEALNGQQAIFTLTNEYHSLLDGKWNHMMGFWKEHSMYKEVDTTSSCIPPMRPHIKNRYTLTAVNGKFGPDSYIIQGLGYSNCALSIVKDDTFHVILPSSTDSLTVTLAFVPNHPADADKLEVYIEIEDEKPFPLQYQTYGRSEEWKKNIERNQALRSFTLSPSSKTRALKIKATTPAVILDEIKITE